MQREKRRAAAQAAAEQKAKQGGGWVGWLWGGGGGGQSKPEGTEEDADMRADLSQEEYQKLEEIVQEQEAAVQQGALCKTIVTLRAALSKGAV